MLNLLLEVSNLLSKLLILLFKVLASSLVLGDIGLELSVLVQKLNVLSMLIIITYLQRLNHSLELIDLLLEIFLNLGMLFFKLIDSFMSSFDLNLLKFNIFIF